MMMSTEEYRKLAADPEKVQELRDNGTILREARAIQHHDIQCAIERNEIELRTTCNDVADIGGARVGFGVYKQWKKDFVDFAEAMESQLFTMLKHPGIVSLWMKVQPDFEYYLRHPRQIFVKLRELNDNILMY